LLGLGSYIYPSLGELGPGEEGKQEQGGREEMTRTNPIIGRVLLTDFEGLAGEGGVGGEIVLSRHGGERDDERKWVLRVTEVLE
jgi:hypothetical protein